MRLHLPTRSWRIVASALSLIFVVASLGVVAQGPRIVIAPRASPCKLPPVAGASLR